ncbi:MAG: two-component response regulator [Candidatus Scalindua rubra]|uniref:Two-component response regulator n=1 Tax=Candidatus Scalindua rubra TaxID=1872076 RepID=A0A1E3X8K0_9BACT|nr:MAG: two-component response regulator [Candidatus Scalindua rubra]
MNKILIVDDEAGASKFLERFLERKGYDVITSDNGEDALEKVKNEKPDIILLDIRMPGMGGMDVLKETRKISPETMVIIHTGYGDLTSAIDAIRFNANDYVLKPCNFEELHFRVRRCIEKLELQRKIKLYEKILPVCCVCKKIRDDTNMEHGTGKWTAMEVYMSEKANIDVSHTFCPECFKKNFKRDIACSKVL